MIIHLDSHQHWNKRIAIRWSINGRIPGWGNWRITLVSFLRRNKRWVGHIIWGIRCSRIKCKIPESSMAIQSRKCWWLMVALILVLVWKISHQIYPINPVRVRLVLAKWTHTLFNHSNLWAATLLTHSTQIAQLHKSRKWEAKVYTKGQWCLWFIKGKV